MTNESNTSEVKSINIFFDIFGYSFVGILAYIFGLVLQNYNSKESTLFSSIASLSLEGKQIIILSIIQILLILLFGHTYATVILYGRIYEDDNNFNKYTNVCNKVGQWLMTLFVCVAIFLLLNQILRVDFLPLNFWITALSIISIYVLNLLIYQILVRKKTVFQQTAKYALVCPAFLMIGVNIYTGSNIMYFLRYEIICFVPMCIFFLIYILLFVFNNKKTSIIYILFGAFTVGSGIASIYFKNSYTIQLIMRNLFLAIMVSVFLFIFESWYVAFRQLKNTDDETYAKVSSTIITLSAPIVVLLFPIQDFNLIYLISFFCGMLFTEYMWFFRIYSGSKNDKEKTNSEDDDFKRKKRSVAISRALCGILTLIFLIMDKYLQIPVPKQNLNSNSLNTADIVNIISLIITIISFVISILPSKITDHFFQYFSDNHCKKYMIYQLLAFFIVIVLSFPLYIYIDADPDKKLFSAFITLLFLLVEIGYILYFGLTKSKKDNKGEDEEK